MIHARAFLTFWVLLRRPGGEDENQPPNRPICSHRFDALTAKTGPYLGRRCANIRICVPVKPTGCTAQDSGRLIDMKVQLHRLSIPKGGTTRSSRKSGINPGAHVSTSSATRAFTAGCFYAYLPHTLGNPGPCVPIRIGCCHPHSAEPCVSPDEPLRTHSMFCLGAFTHLFRRNVVTGTSRPVRQ